jgi:hypothetical protein
MSFIESHDQKGYAVIMQRGNNLPGGFLKPVGVSRMPADAFVLTKVPARKFHGPGQQARRQFFVSTPIGLGSSETCIRSRITVRKHCRAD